MSINGNEMKLDAVNMEKDLGITFDKRLEFDYHIQEKTKKANSMLDYVWHAQKNVQTFR